ncbi:glycine-rich domain-containing protein [Peterkaempfera sp. SMS 1(5)a]|uniref:glycine-rich domain-containing protein n=1 Tax=Peterkaempfera podocarpi TaxID=3232308 RepID=UPI00366CA70A
MTITDLPALTRQGRNLIDPQLFDRLVTRITKDHPDVDRPMAERIMDQAAAFLAACATATEPIGPSGTVDVGWHTFILHTHEYARFCQRIAGRFIHHEPDDSNDEGGTRRDTGAPLPRTIAAIRAAGYRIDPELWGTGADCNSGGSNCTQCHAGCHDSPRG